MAWDSVIGQQRIKNQLIALFKQQRHAQAYLFTGQSGVGKEAVALEFAKVLNCERGEAEACGKCASCLAAQTLQHPNINLVFALPVGKGEVAGDPPLAKLQGDEIQLIQQQLQQKSQNPYHSISLPQANTIKVNSIREIRRISSLSTSKTNKRVFIIINADGMNDEASNALLKTLEEPHENTMLILTTARPAVLLPTIISRCQVVRFDSLQEEEIQAALESRNAVDKMRAGVIARVANGSYSRALELIDTSMFDRRGKAVDFLRTAVFKTREDILHFVDEIASVQQRGEIEDFLQSLQSWLRDAMLLHEGYDRIVNIDDVDALKKFSALFPDAEYARLFDAIDRAISLLNKNVYIPLILIHLSIQLRTIIVVEADSRKQVSVNS